MSILAVTPQREIVLVEQFRIPVQRRVIEIPAGIVGDEEEHLGESLAACAARELLEETGYRAGLIEELIASPTSAGLTSEFVHLFHATELRREHQGGGVAGEEIAVHHAPLDGLRDWLCERETRARPSTSKSTPRYGWRGIESRLVICSSNTHLRSGEAPFHPMGGRTENRLSIYFFLGF